MPFDATPLRQDTRVTETLRRALALIEAGWTKKASARDRWGHSRSPLAPSAVRFCSAGAIHHVAPHEYARAERAIIAVLNRPDITRPDITVWNDDPATKKKDVIRAFEEAIEASREVVNAI